MVEPSNGGGTGTANTGGGGGGGNRYSQGGQVVQELL